MDFFFAGRQPVRGWASPVLSPISRWGPREAVADDGSDPRGSSLFICKMGTDIISLAP